jgi:hypothetical protein
MAALVEMILLAGPAAATTTTSTTTPTTSTAPLSSSQADTAAILALSFGLLAIIAVLVFLSWDRIRSFQALKDAGQVGSATVHDESPFARASLTKSSGASGAVSIVGPKALSLNEPTNYLVQGDTAGANPSWKVQGDATISPPSGQRTQLTAKSAGAIILSVSVGTESATTEIAATAPPRSSTIPFLGQGYGSVVIALSVASVTAALGLTNIINGQAVAGILGSLVTYSVVRGANAGSSGSTAKSGNSDGSSQD